MKITNYILMFFSLACLINVVTVICDKDENITPKKKSKKSSGSNSKNKSKRSLEQSKGIAQEKLQKQVQGLGRDDIDLDEANADDVRDILVHVLESEEMKKNQKALRRKKITISVLTALFSLLLIGSGIFGGIALYKRNKSKSPSPEQDNQQNDQVPSGSGGQNDGNSDDSENWKQNILPDFEK